MQKRASVDVDAHGPAPTPLREAIGLVRPHLTATFAFTAVVNVVFLAPTLYMLGIYDMALPASSIASLALLTVLLAVSMALLSGLDWIRGRLLMSAAARLDRVFSARLYARCMSITDGTGSRRLGQTLREFETLRGALTGGAVLAIFDTPWVPIYIAVCFYLHAAIGVFALVGSLLLLGFAALNEQALRRASANALQAAAVQSSLQDATASSVDVINALGMRAAMTDTLKLARLKAAAPMQKAIDVSARNAAVAKFARLFLQSSALGLGAWLAIHHQISAGAIFASSMLATRAFAPIDQIVSQWRTMAAAGAAYDALKSQLAPLVAAPATILTAPEPNITVKALSVTTPARDRILLRDLNFTATGGQVVAVIGPSGAGKTTLLQVLANARTPEAGEVLIDGANYRQWTSETLGRHLGYLPQDFPLFPGTVAQNISRFQKIDAQAPGSVVEAARLAGAHDLILALPLGYETVVNVGGAGLSMGQRQRVALARALYGDPKLLILDEPNSSLDADAEQHLLQTIMVLKDRGALIVLSTHANGFIDAADQLLVLQNGRQHRFGPRAVVLEDLLDDQLREAFHKPRGAQTEAKPRPQVQPEVQAQPHFVSRASFRR